MVSIGAEPSRDTSHPSQSLQNANRLATQILTKQLRPSGSLSNSPAWSSYSSLLTARSISSSSSPRSFSPIQPEPDRCGNLEYKLRILPVSASRFSRLVTQLKWRLAEGGGLAVYEIGVLDDGTLVGLLREEMRSSLAQLALMGRALGATCEVRRCILVERGTVANRLKSIGNENNFSEAEPGPNPHHTTASLQSQDPTPALSSSAETVIPDLMAYKHRTESSSKNTSAGLDNIVGLRALDNEEAAKVLGRSTPGARNAAKGNCWVFGISRGADDVGDESTDHVDGDESSGGDTECESSEEKDGFAFSLSLSDDEVAPPRKAAYGKAELSGPSNALRRPRSINNSPWSRFDQASPSPISSWKVTPAESAGSGSLRQSNHANGGRHDVSHAHPSAHKRQDSAPVSCLNELESLRLARYDRHMFLEARSDSAISSTSDSSSSPRNWNTFSYQRTDLSGQDVDGVLRLTIDSAASGHHNRGNQVNFGQDPGPSDNVEQTETGSDDAVKADREYVGLQAPQFLYDDMFDMGQTFEKTSKKMTRSNRGPRVERRARRLAEHKAREREGQGFFAALDYATMDSGERKPWWKYSGLTFERNLPFYDAARHGWIREVADWLTVTEVEQLADSWRPGGAKRGPRSDEDEQITCSHVQIASESATGKESADKAAHTGETGALDKTTFSSQNTLPPAQAARSRKAGHRRRRKEKRQEAAAAAAETAHRRAIQGELVYGPGPPTGDAGTDHSAASTKGSLKVHAAQPHYLPPPSNALPILRLQQLCQAEAGDSVRCRCSSTVPTQSYEGGVRSGNDDFTAVMTTTDDEPPVCLNIEARGVPPIFAKSQSEVDSGEAVLAEFTSSECVQNSTVNKEEPYDDRRSLTANTEAAPGIQTVVDDPGGPLRLIVEAVLSLRAPPLH